MIIDNLLGANQHPLVHNRGLNTALDLIGVNAVRKIVLNGRKSVCVCHMNRRSVVLVHIILSDFKQFLFVFEKSTNKFFYVFRCFVEYI